MRNGDHRAFHRRATVAGLILIAAWTATAGCGKKEATTSTYIAEIDAWHATRLENLRSDTGWLTLVGLYPLKDGVNIVGSDPVADVRLDDKAPLLVGSLAIAEGHIAFVAEPGVEVTVAGEDDASTNAVTLTTDREGEPTTLVTGTLSFFVIERDGALFLRVKDRESEVLKNFSGIERFPVDARWRVVAQLTSGATSIKVANALGQEIDEDSPGALVFELNGRECRLWPTGDATKGLFIVFGDATNGHDTYGGGRFLSTDPVSAIGTVVLDFNRAYNPPCVFTPYATCPLPGVANTLPLAVAAGEKSWGAVHQ